MATTVLLPSVARIGTEIVVVDNLGVVDALRPVTIIAPFGEEEESVKLIKRYGILRFTWSGSLFHLENGEHSMRVFPGQE